jgi:acyl-CoA thioesterase
MPDAFYLPDGDRLVATELTRGPWHLDHQHGGPPAALLARALEARAGEDWHVARITVEFLRPLTIGPPHRVTTRVTRPGRRVLGLAAEILTDDQVVARAAALAVRRAPLDLPPDAPPADVPRDPEAFPVHRFAFFRWEVGYHSAMDVRLESGRVGHGPATAWLRPKHPLVAGEPTSPLQRVMIAADAINGVGHVLDLARFTFVNADLTVYLHRLPEGEWLRMAAEPSPQPAGVGLVEAALADRRGPVGRALEAQVLGSLTTRA